MAVLRAKQKEVEAIEAQLEKMMNELKVYFTRSGGLCCYHKNLTVNHIINANKLFSNPIRYLSNSTVYIILKPLVVEHEGLISNPFNV